MRNLLLCAAVGLGGASIFALTIVQMVVPCEATRVEDDPAFQALQRDNAELRLQLDALRRQVIRSRVTLSEPIPATGTGGADAIPATNLPTSPKE